MTKNKETLIYEHFQQQKKKKVKKRIDKKELMYKVLRMNVHIKNGVIKMMKRKESM